MINIMKRYCVGVLVMYLLLVEFGNTKRTHKQCKEQNRKTLVCNYIPKLLFKQYVHVRFIDCIRDERSVLLNSSSFIHESWAKVLTIEFNDITENEYFGTFSRECFKGLVALKELKIHLGDFKLDENAFVGLSSVHTLDVSKCYRLLVADVLKTLKMKSALPALKRLIMSGIGSYSAENVISQTDLDYIPPRQISTLDLSRNQITFVNNSRIIQSFSSLKSLNVSYSILSDLSGFYVEQNNLIQLEVIDISNAVLPVSAVSLIPGKYVGKNMVFKYSEVTDKGRYLHIENFLTPSVVNASGILPSMVSVWIYNSTLIIDVPLHWKVKQFVGRNNNFKYLDAILVCPIFKFTSLYHVDISYNGLEMVRPSKCFPNLEIYELSNNKLFKMLENNEHLFEKLFAYHSKLRIINIANNHLPKIPKTFFKYNKNTEVIDLSFNQLEQLHFDMMDLHNLRQLDVSNNNIKVLDEISIRSLNDVPCVGSHSSFGDRCLLIMKSNPFLCSQCACKSSIKWLVNLKHLQKEQQDLMCMSEDSTSININESAIKRIQKICNRKLIIISSTVSAFVTITIVCIICIILYRRKRMLKRRRQMENVLARFKEGEGQYEFVAFLSYSSGDYQFVQDHVINQLNENLKLVIETDRNLICTGDQYFRPGFTLLDETEQCLDRASVVILLLSDNFCRSSYCQNEFNQAYMQGKPIVLMILGNVEEELMMPSLKSLYRRNVRILWKVDNNEFVLSTTWGNVCNSLLEKTQV
ncbi:protein toll-like [Ruditapes philippinarum]|uniref:protein toll-like n=1 Tax=Ruditapes philippinarum TaxID=129788 RepID=UPI00295C2F1F|nr:protein toll-like [Ruditapes philippinarum]